MKTTKNRSKALLAGMAAMALVFGLVLAGCSTDDGGGNTDPKSITITGLSGITDVEVYVLSSASDEPVATGDGTIESNSVTVALIDAVSEENWIGNGDYFVAFADNSENMYLYTNGSSFSDLDISKIEEDFRKAPRLGFNSALTTVDRSKFIKED